MRVAVEGRRHLQEAVAAEIAEQARDAVSSGGFAVSAHLYKRAAELTTAPDERSRLRLAAVEAFTRSGEWSEAETLLDSQLLDAPNGARSDVIRARARIALLRGRLAEAVDLLVAEAERLAPREPALASELLVEAAAQQFQFDFDTGVELARRARELGGPGSPAVLVHEGLRLGRGDRNTLGANRIDDAARTVLEAGNFVENFDLVVYGAAPALVFSRKFEQALHVLDAVVEEIRERRALAYLPDALNARANTRHRTGEWEEATRDYEEAIEIGTALGERYVVAATLAWFARLEAARGHAASCRATIARARSEFAGFEPKPFMAATLAATERLLLLTLEASDLVLEHSIDADELRFAEDWIEAAIRVGRRDDAETMLAAYEALAENSGQPFPRMKAARCRGLLAPDDEFELAFQRAFECERARPYAFERARIELCYGERLRRANERKRAREPLQAAYDGFARLGAAHWAKRAAGELHATGTRVRHALPGSIEELTAQELAVVRAVGSGATNKEAAEQLFLSVKTIEFHLRNAFRKLDVRSRTELARYL